MHVSDSTEQRDIEKVILEILHKEYSDIRTFIYQPEDNKKLSFQIDGYSESTNSYFEFYAGLTELKPGQKRKLASDILKLITIEKIVGKPINKYIITIDEKISNKLKSFSWLSKSVELFNIEVRPLEISEEEMDKIRVAKQRQNLFKPNHQKLP